MCVLFGAGPRPSGVVRQVSIFRFYRRFEDEIFGVVDDMAEELGVRDVLQALARCTDLEVHRPADWTDGLVRVAVEQVMRQVACDAAEATPLSA